MPSPTGFRCLFSYKMEMGYIAMEFFSRSPVNEINEYIRDHLKDVCELASTFAAVWDGEKEAQISGALHDAGKYGDLFQALLRGETKHVDHWSTGAYLALLQYKASALAAALAIQGHHIGLMQTDPRQLQDSLVASTRPGTSDARQWAGNPPEALLKRWREDAQLSLPDRFISLRDQHTGHAVTQMLDVRMLFSALVDADWLSAEAHENRDDKGPVYRKAGPKLNADTSLAALEQYMGKLRLYSKASPQLQQARDYLFQSCWDAGVWPKGLFTLCAPTGSGKTMATLAFLLRQCQKNGLRRIIVVLPYLSILDQTVVAYREIFDAFGLEYVIEDDSLAQDISGSDRLRHLAQNWDAPVIITTTVRFFDSLFSNRPADCRKLHNIASSAVLFDEAQTMPLKLALPTLAAITVLTRVYGCTAVFSTATQPAFGSFDSDVKKYAGAGWAPASIVDAKAPPFQVLRRVQVEYDSAPIALEDIARKADGLPSALFIVNKKAHASRLYRAFQAGDEKRTVLHLSTNMCPAHRRDILGCVHAALEGKGCTLIATQCVEAGVDLDFPYLFRALAPLEALCQAAGRCNRNGRSLGLMRVFIPQSDGRKPYPDDIYEKGANLVAAMADEAGAFPDIFDPDVIRRYYERLYVRIQGERGVQNQDLIQALNVQDFEEVARKYRWIEQGGVNILVPYTPFMEEYERLAAEARSGQATRAWFVRARRLTVSAFMRRDSAAEAWLEPVKIGEEAVPKWYVLTNPALYRQDIGLDLALADDASNFIL